MKVLVIDDSASDTQEIVSLFEEFQRQTPCISRWIQQRYFRMH